MKKEERAGLFETATGPREIHPQTETKTCSMCGKYCAVAIMEDYLK